MGKFQMIRGFPFPNRLWKKKNIEEALDYVPQDDDIVLTSYPKTGTNWLQYIVLQITSNGESFPSVHDCRRNKVLFMEMTGSEAIDKMEGLRIYRYHCRYDMVQKNPKSKVIYIYRKPEDTLVSYYHYKKSVRREENISFDEFFEAFLEGNIEYGGYFDHVLSYLAHKEDGNLLLVSYEKLHANRREEILRIAKFLGEGFFQNLSDNESLLENILKNTSFDYMKRNLKYTVPRDESSNSSADESEYAIEFFRKGTVGDGKRSLSSDQLKRLRKKATEKMIGTEVLKEWID